MTAPDELLDLARDAALTAGALIKRRRAEGVEVADRKSSPVDVVTYADRESEALIRAMLHDARPDDGFFGEESDATDGTSGLTWVVDPIDGTVNYLYDIPAYCVSIAVVEGDPATGRALAGAVYNPVLDELYTAIVGGGAFLGDRRLQVNTDVELSQAMISTGFAYTADLRERQAAIVQRLIGHVRDIRRFGSSALDLCNIARGRLDAYYERGLKPWDYAAGALVAAEAGARVTIGEGERHLLLAAAPGVYDAIRPYVEVPE